MNSNSHDDRVQKLFAGLPYNSSNDEALATLQESLVEFSHMADSKANIMITVCSILLTLAIAKMEQGVLMGPSIIFSAFCVPALMFSILTVMPSPTNKTKRVGSEGKFRHFNPLFFMHFTEVSLDEFNEEMDRLLRDPQELYRGLTKDIYFAGHVLRVKKFRYLRWSYLSLLFGVFFGGLVLAFNLLMRSA